MKKSLALIVFMSASLCSGLTQAMLVSYDVEYLGWWEADGGGSLFGTLVADTSAGDDGIIDFASELSGWTWSWTGNTFVSAFAISSEDAGAGVDIIGDVAGMFVDGTPNLPDFSDGLDQGIFIGGDSGEFVIDLEFLTLEDNTVSFPFGGDFTSGDVLAASATINVSAPRAVPAPTSLALLAIAFPVLLRRRRRAAKP